MESESSQTKACACRATHNQRLANECQLEIIRKCISVGNKNSTLKEYVLRKTGQKEGVWDQMLIFLALVSFRPKMSKIVPPLQVDEVWHLFILCTNEYTNFCQSIAGRYLHHVPDALSVGKKRSNWFRNIPRLTNFLDGQISQYDQGLWYDPEDFEIITREKYNQYKHYNENHVCYSSHTSYAGPSGSGCDSCGERCAD